jgi:hypothetical protein
VGLDKPTISASLFLPPKQGSHPFRIVSTRKLGGSGHLDHVLGVKYLVNVEQDDDTVRLLGHAENQIRVYVRAESGRNLDFPFLDFCDIVDPIHHYSHEGGIGVPNWKGLLRNSAMLRG